MTCRLDRSRQWFDQANRRPWDRGLQRDAFELMILAGDIVFYDGNLADFFTGYSE